MWIRSSRGVCGSCRAAKLDARLQPLLTIWVDIRGNSGVFMRRFGIVAVWIFIGLAAAGCPGRKGNQAYKAGQKSMDVEDYDAAVDYYAKAQAADPHNAFYKIKLNQARFQAGEKHIKAGFKLRDKNDLQGAISEFQRAQIMDPSNSVPDQELRKTLEMLAERARAADQTETESASEGSMPALASAPPELKPLSRAPIALKMSNDSKVVFDTIGKLAGLTIIYDPDLQARKINADLNNVTIEQALDIVCLESKTFWKPVTENIILIAPDSTQKRRDYDEQVVRTFYLGNVAIAQDLTEITTGLRSLLDLKHIQQVNAQNAIIVRDTPDKLALIEKLIKDIDKAKPEVLLDVQILQASTDHMKNLGILPPQQTTVSINPNNSSSSTSSSTSSTTSSSGVTLQNFAHLNGSDYVFTIPSASANFLMTDSSTKIIQSPEIRALDGQQAKLNIGQRVPVATGSFQAGVGVGSTAGAGFVNPLVNTQFQYLDVGVNIDVTPHIHPNRDVSMKLSVEVSSVANYVTIGGIQQPVIAQNKSQEEIRLKEGEVSILAGLIQRIDTRTLNGWPWLANIPIMRYMFSADNTDLQDSEVLIVLTPHIVRMPEWNKGNLRGLFAGTDSNPGVRREQDLKTPNPVPVSAVPNLNGGPSASAPMVTPASGTVSPLAANASASVAVAPVQTSGPRMRFDPATLNLAPGQTATLNLVVDGATDLFSVPMMLQYNPAVINIEEVRQGGFLSGGNQDIAIVQHLDKEHGQAIISSTRQPNTQGVNGSGTLLGIVVKAVGAGNSTISIVQVNAKDSQMKPISFVTNEANLRVQP
jgi:general secretion pathway protein D